MKKTQFTETQIFPIVTIKTVPYALENGCKEKNK